MLININEVAKRLKISNRAVQIKAKKQGIQKIGNQYQITQEIAERWYNSEGKTKRSETEPSGVVSYANRKKHVSVDLSIITIIAALFISAFIFFLYSQLEEKKEELHKSQEELHKSQDELNLERTDHKNDVKELSIKLENSKDTIHKKELEIQRLTPKTPQRLFRP